MGKRNPPFEQVPVDTAKKLSRTRSVRARNVVVERSASKVEPYATAVRTPVTNTAESRRQQNGG